MTLHTAQKTLSSNQDKKKIKINLLSLGIKKTKIEMSFFCPKSLELYFKNIHHIFDRCSDF